MAWEQTEGLRYVGRRTPSETQRGCRERKSPVRSTRRFSQPASVDGRATGGGGVTAGHHSVWICCVIPAARLVGGWERLRSRPQEVYILRWGERGLRGWR